MSAPTVEPGRRAFDVRASEELVLARGRELAERARAAGADEAEAYATHGRSISVTFEKGDLRLAQVDEGGAVGLRVFEGRRLGFSSSNQLDEAALARTAADAVALARMNSPEPENRLPEARDGAASPLRAPQGIVDVPVERVVELARELASSIVERDPRISLETASVSTHVLARGVVTAAGVERAESDAALTLSLMGMAVDGDDVGGFHVAGEHLRDAGDFEAVRARVAREFSEVLLGNLAAGAAESYRGPVLFSPEALLSVFVSPLLSAVSAIAVQRGRSALRDALGTAVANPVLSVVDDPTDPELAGRTSFDREGQPVARTSIVREGVLESFLYNGYAAHVEGRRSTGHAVGGTRSVPGLGPHAIAVAPGTGGTRDDLLARLDRGLYVERFSGSVNPTTGDFSGVAKSARWIEGGRPVRSVRETLISGNAFELLRGDLVLGSEAKCCRGSTRAPLALVDGLSVTAG